MGDLNQTFGALLIGLQFSALLFGFLTLQSYLYYRKFWRDTLTLKFTVALLWLLNTSHLCFISHAQYFYLVNHFLPSSEVDVEIWTLLIHIGITVVVIFVVQCYFTERLWSLSGKSVTLVASIIPLMVARLGIGLVTTVTSIRVGHFSQMSHERGWIIACFASVIPTDVIICVAMFYFLRKSRREATETYSLFNTLLLYTLNTGLIPCLLAIVSLICYLTMDDDALVFIAIHFVLGQLYTNSMLVILNSRASLGGKGNYTSTHLLATSTEPDTTIEDTSAHTRATDSMHTSHRHLVQIDTHSAVSLEYRGVRVHSPSTPVYHIENAENLQATSVRRSLAPLPEEAHGYDRSNSGASESGRSHLTGPSMSWESLQSARMGNCDLGDPEWER